MNTEQTTNEIIEEEVKSGIHKFLGVKAQRSGQDVAERKAAAQAKRDRKNALRLKHHKKI